MSNSTILTPTRNSACPVADGFSPAEPNDADWAEFIAWAEEQDAIQADLDQLPEPTADEWTAHVRGYLTAHNLAEVPF